MMNDTRRKSVHPSTVVITLLAVALIGGALYFRFTNPLLTETQLLLRFWWYWLVMIVGGIGAYLWIARQ